jgi:hypothetical protein
LIHNNSYLTLTCFNAIIDRELINGHLSWINCDGLKKLDRKLLTLKFLSYEKFKTNI